MRKKMEYSQPIRALEELERKFSAPVHRMVEWAVGECGKVVSATTLDQRRGSYTVVKSHVPANTEFPLHQHDQKEFLIITEGHAILHMEDGESIELRGGEGKAIPPGIPHIFEAIRDTWVIAVTIPDSEAFAK